MASVSPNKPGETTPQQRYENLVNKAAKQFEGRLVELVHSTSLYDKNSKEYMFFSKVTETAMRNIEQSTKNQGVIFKVSKDGVDSYLLGTVHLGTYHMANQPLMQQIVENASELITEIGDVTNASEATSLFAKQTNLRFKHCLDLNLTALAQAKKIQITALETLEESQRNTRDIKADMAIRQIPNDLAIHAEYNEHELIEMWQQGDLEKFNSLPIHPSTKEIMIDSRNKKWENSIVHKLNGTTKPIAIAIGVLHLIGESGLVKTLQNEGFTVEQVKQNPEANP